MTRESYKKHKEIIEAWADGAEIEHYDGANWTIDDPQWDMNPDYRIKPKSEILYEWMTLSIPSDIWLISYRLCTKEEAKNIFKSYKDYKQTGRSWKL